MQSGMERSLDLILIQLFKKELGLLQYGLKLKINNIYIFMLYETAFMSID
jgi:hypothetical protein